MREAQRPSGEEIGTRFGAGVKVRRRELGLTQDDLAEKAGMHRTNLAEMERGTRSPSLRSVEKLTGALEISISEFFARYIE